MTPITATYAPRANKPASSYPITFTPRTNRATYRR
jgi:hypothetical protein